MPITKTCEKCGDLYRVPPSRGESSRFCTIACSNAAKVHTARRKNYYKPRPGGLECMICKGKYWALGVHVKHKHGITASDYKRDYGLLASIPLVHDEISEALRESMRRQLADPARKEEMMKTCLKNATENKGKKMPGFFGIAAKEMVAKSNKRRNDEYLLSRKKEVQEYINKKWVNFKKARDDLKIGVPTIKKMILLGMVSSPTAKDDPRHLQI